MAKQDLIHFVQSNDDGSNFVIEDVLWEAQKAGYIDSYKEIHTEKWDQRRWGFTEQFVYIIDNDWYLSFVMYITTGDGGDNTLEDVYEARQVQKTVTSYEEA